MTRVAVEFEWQPIGEVTLVDGKPRFPSLSRAPGVYRLAFHVPDAAARVYIGETTTFVAERRTIGRRVRRSGRVCA